MQAEHKRMKKLLALRKLNLLSTVKAGLPINSPEINNFVNKSSNTENYIKERNTF